MFSRVCTTRFSHIGRRLVHQNAPDVVDTGSGLKGYVVDEKNLLASVSVIAKGGVRLENSASQQGLTSAIKSFSGLRNQKNVSRVTMGTFDKYGVDYNVTLSRELLTYSLTCPKSSLDHVMPFFVAAVAYPAYPYYDLANVRDYAIIESSTFNDNLDAVLFDNLHKAAFRRGLGNSLNVTKQQISAVTEQDLLNFHQHIHRVDNVIVTSSGVEKGELSKYFGSWPVTQPSGSIAFEKSKFYPDESRTHLSRDNNVRVAIGAESGPSNSKESIVAGVLTTLLAKDSFVSHGNQPVELAPSALAQGFNFDYSDTGIFGIHIHSCADNAGNVIKLVKESLNKLKASLTDDHVQMGKNEYLRLVMDDLLEHPSHMLEHIGSNIVLNTMQQHDKFSSTLNEITTGDISQLIDKLLNGPRSMSVLGNAENVPYLDEL